MKKKNIKFEFIKKNIIYKFIKLIYYKIHNLKFIKKYHTTTGTYYLPIFAFKDIIRNKIMKNEIYQEEIVNLAKYFIKPNSIVLDVGANYGQMSVMFSKSQNNVKVYSFEAQRFIFNILQKNVALNNANVKCFYNLVGNINLEVKVKKNSLGKCMTWGSNNLKITNSNLDCEFIKAIKIDDLNINENISFFKIDVQGMDFEVLKGSRLTIAKHKMPILFEYEKEFEEEYDYKFNDIEDFINSINYKILKIVDENLLILPN
jgi:FkbM family methyltransferase